MRHLYDDPLWATPTTVQCLRSGNLGTAVCVLFVNWFDSVQRALDESWLRASARRAIVEYVTAPKSQQHV